VSYLVIPLIYTVIAFGASIFLWSFLPSIILLEGMPLYLAHPYFTAELFFMLSTLIVWVVAMLFSLHNIRKQKIALVKSLTQNGLIVCLALFTVLVAILGCEIYSRIVERHPADLHDLYALDPPNPFAVIHGYGILFCEGAWIIVGIAKLFKEFKKLQS